MRKRKKPLKTILIAFGVICLALTTVSAVFVFSELSKISAPEKLEYIAPENEFFDTDSNGDYGADAPQLEPGDVVWPMGDKLGPETPTGFPENVKPADNKTTINILLIGQDKRPGEKRARSDTIIIASYSKREKALKLISLMRDMYVPIPGYSDNRINAAYQFGGMRLLGKTIEKDFGVTIDGTVEVDFEGFMQTVEMLGGLSIPISKAEAAHLNKKFGWKLAIGRNHLDGQQTLEYARIRYVGNGDFERTDRQRIVLAEIYDTFMALNLTQKYQMLDRMLPHLTTDMSKQEILSYALTVLSNGIRGTESYRIPADGAYRTAKIRKMAVLVPNLAKARALIRGYMNE
jgi:LCP family protein required for cell wall assembly